MGGIVQDEEGKPISGRGSRFICRSPGRREIAMSFPWRTPPPTARAAGNTTVRRPNSSRLSSFSIEHPEYLGMQQPERRPQEIVVVLKQGNNITGRVVDREGKPVASPSILWNGPFGSDEPETATDAEGLFTLRNCRPGASAVTVRADAMRRISTSRRRGQERAGQFQVGAGPCTAAARRRHRRQAARGNDGRARHMARAADTLRPHVD